MPDGMIKRQEDPPGETRLQVDPNKISMIEWFLPEEDGPYGDSETQVLVDPRFKLALLKAIAPGEVVSYTDGFDGDILLHRVLKVRFGQERSPINSFATLLDATGIAYTQSTYSV